MERKTPTALGGRGMEKLAGGSNASFSTMAYRAQIVAARYALPLETAAIIAALAFGGSQHG
jgi:hypothetical protein